MIEIDTHALLDLTIDDLREFGASDFSCWYVAGVDFKLSFHMRWHKYHLSYSQLDDLIKLGCSSRMFPLELVYRYRQEKLLMFPTTAVIKHTLKSHSNQVPMRELLGHLKEHYPQRIIPYEKRAQ